MELTLPLDYSFIERILPHRYPFLLVDRITEFEQDKRIVGIKNISLNERYLSHREGEQPVMPPTILTETAGELGTGAVGACFVSVAVGAVYVSCTRKPRPIITDIDKICSLQLLE